MALYLSNGVWEEWSEILRPLPGLTRFNGEVLEPGDLFIGELAERPAGVKCFAPCSLRGTGLAELIEWVKPNLDVDRDLLELAWRGLNDPERGWDSAEDVARLFRFSKALWSANLPLADLEWLRLAELAYHFGFTTVPVPGDPAGTLRPLFEAMGYAKWGDFSIDFLGVRPETSSQMKWIWEVYAVRLKMSREEMAAIGKAKLACLSNALRKATEEPAEEERVVDLLKLLKESTFAELNDMLRAEKSGGVVSLIRRDEIDWTMVAKWLKTKPLPEQILVDANIDGEHIENALVIIINPAVLPEDAMKIRTRMGSSLRWDKRVAEMAGD
jgi:hypothetical protein